MSAAAVRKPKDNSADYTSRRIDRSDADAIVKRTAEVLTSAPMSTGLSTKSKSELDHTHTPSNRPDFLGKLEDDLSNVIRYAAPKPIEERPEIFIVAVQEWEGFVDEVHEDYFTALMYDVTADQKRPAEYMEIPRGLVNEEDIRLVSEGNVFRLVIGRERRRGGPVQNKTLVYFRKMKFKVKNNTDVNFSDLIAKWD